MWLVSAYSSHSVHQSGRGDDNSHYNHKAKEVGPQSTKGVGTWYAKGSVHGMQGEGLATESSGIVEVVMWLCAPLLVGSFHLAWV